MFPNGYVCTTHIVYEPENILSTEGLRAVAMRPERGLALPVRE